MRILIIKILIFISPLILFSYGLDNYLSSVLKKSYSFADGEYAVWNDLYNGKINSDIVIYGSSRALVHIDPVMIGDSLKTTVYNLGVNGHSFRSQYFRHSLLLKYNTKPRMIIQTVDITSFEKKSDLYNQNQYLPYMLNNEDMKLSACNGFHSMEYNLPLCRYWGKKEALIEIGRLILIPSGNRPLRTKGFEGRDLSWNDDLLVAEQKLGTYKVESDSSMIHLFESYLEDCARQNIKLVFVNPPVYIEGQKFVSNWSETMNIYYMLSKKYNIPFFDYSLDSISFHKELFYNSAHLNRRGAELLTSNLIKHLQKLDIVSTRKTSIAP